MSKSLTELTREVDEFCHDKGWRGEITFGERMALLHSEISEALEAYRDWGLADATGSDIRVVAAGELPKPEGVGSELADILIRLLDDTAVIGVDLETEVAKLRGQYIMSVKFGEQMNGLHHMTCAVYMAFEDSLWPTGDAHPIWGTVPSALANLYQYLTQVAEINGIDLEAEYERKMAYNRTRPYRHGGKNL